MRSFRRKSITRYIFENIYLDSTEEIVRYSFLVQKSITPLDLSTLEYSQLTPTPCTEASFQKRFNLNDRWVLFKYHLDVSHDLEKAKKEHDPTLKYVSIVYSSVKIRSNHDYYYYPCVHHGIVEAIEKSRDKTAELRKFLPLMKRMQVSSEYFGARQFSFFARILQEECTDSELVAEFIEVCGNESISRFLLFNNDKIEHMEYFLCHSQKMKIDMQFETVNVCPISRCLFLGTFKRAIALIKYGKIRRTLIDGIIRFIPIFRYDGLTAINCMKFITRNYGQPELCSDQLSCVKKGLLLLVCLLCYRAEYERYPSRKNESCHLGIHVLRLMSRSLPESYLTLFEIRSVWRLDSDLWPEQPTAEQVYHFYQTYIMDGGNQDFDVEGPRSLKHFARCAIRERLAANCALPDGIQLLGLPQQLLGFLRLES